LIARHQLSPISPYRGVLVSDCLSISDDLTPLQQKCYAHHLKKIGAALAGPAAGSAFLADLRGLLSGAMALKAAMPGLPAGRVVAMRAALDANAERLLGTPRAGPEERIRQRIAKQRDHLFTFLDHPAVDATNNFAERQLRPAVISRKLSCGNKTEAGARTWETLTSLAATCQQTGISLVDHLAQHMAIPPETKAGR
jgi:transposase